MEIKILILLCMIFCHITDDFYLQKQGWLATGKCKSWWEKNAPEALYKYDYIAVLLLHSFSWAFMVMLVPTIYILFVGGTWYPMCFIVNLLLHAKIDNLKANKNEINLIQDQLFHFSQIIAMWLWLVV